MGRFPRRLLRVVLWSAVVLAVVSGAYTVTVGIARDRTRSLPAPTGSYVVGREQRQWTDQSRIDPLAPTPGQPRALAVWLWYPAAAATSASDTYAH